jgi:glycosidase
MNSSFKLIRILVLAAMLLGLPGNPRPVQAAAADVPSVNAALNAASGWCVAGEINGWNNTSDPLYDDGTHGDLIPGDGIYSLAFNVSTSGRKEWKVVKCGDWGTAYPADNAWLITAAPDESVTFTFDTNDHSGDVGVNLTPKANIVNVLDSANDFTAVGDFQGWNNSDAATHLGFVGNGYFRYEFVQPTAGTYAGKVVRTGSWDSFGTDGRNKNGGNLSYTTTTGDQRVVVLLDARSGRSAFLPQGTPGAGSYCLTGGMQPGGGWYNSSDPMYDDGTHGDLTAGDGVFTLDYTVSLAAGRYEWKVFTCGTWNGFPTSGNSFVFTTTNPQTIKFTFDTNDHTADVGWKLLPAQNILNAWDSAPAAISAVGDHNSWNNNDANYTLASLGNGYHYLARLMTPGSYNAKLVLRNSWDAWGADGRSVNAGTLAFNAYFSDEPVYFLFDYYTGRGLFYAAAPASHELDGLVEINGLGHNSQDDLYRSPAGAVETGTTVYLRFHTFHNDVESVRVRLYNNALAQEQFKNMTLVGSDLSCYDAALARDTCDYWQLEVDSALLTNLYYRFVITDGADVVYYADDNMKDGGWGTATDTMVDNSYVITYYDPAFAPIPWMQDAVIYQIFPDRFYNGDPRNDPSGTEAHYSYPPETIDQLIRKVWDSLPEGYCRGYVDPAAPCSEAPRGRDFFGGDLQGVIQKLDYLQELGVTVIYFNPIFDAGSNHGYDTRDYLNIQPFFGTNEDFEMLVAEAEAHGIKIVLDGVFNHVSSDSPYFDRYGHYADVLGACESIVSAYRDWFYFTTVTPGTGTCAGILGPNSANYDSWWGFDSIPVMDKSNPEVQDLFLYGTPTADPVATFWLNEGSSGWRLDVMNDSTFPVDFWQNFRAVVKAADAEAVIIGELWKKGDVLPMVLGDTADTTMNYRFRNAVQGFLGTVDNKGFPDDGQSNQPPSTFAKKMLSIREDYPDATYYTLMNLLGTHDTERILWGLTPGDDNREDKEFNAANLAIGTERLELAAVIQMTVPGAPTIYYGDEVGMTGFDDPDDRRAFPWVNYYLFPFFAYDGAVKAIQTLLPSAINFLPDPYYGAAGNHEVLDLYRQLTAIRSSNPAFAEGEMTFLLTDDGNNTLAYLLRTADNAALVAVNNSSATQTLSIDASTYLPYSFELVDALGTLADPVYGVDSVVGFDLPPMSAAILLPSAGQDLTLPSAREFTSVYPANGKVEVSWQITKPVGDQFAVYRSYFTGGGYQLLGITNAETYTDTVVTNGETYFYVLRTIDVTGNYSDYSAEVSATPFYPIGWTGNLAPATLNYPITNLPSAPISAEIYIDGVTTADGNQDEILAQVGYGLTGTAPSTFLWSDIAFSHRTGNNYVYSGTIRPDLYSVYDYLVRFSTTGGAAWTFAYVTGTQAGVATIVASSDITFPDAPTNLRVTDYGSDFIDLAWDASVATDVVEYWIFRTDVTAATLPVRVGMVNVPTTTFHDADVITGTGYQYYVTALDTSLNQSLPSNLVNQTAEVKMITVAFVVQVPFFTPLNDIIYLTGDTAPLEWNPSLRPMVPTSTPGVYFTLAVFPEGTTVQYKYTRGSWDAVEWWGSITSLANRSFVVDGGTGTTQTVDNTSSESTLTDSQKAPQNWRDPLVVGTYPYSGEVLSIDLDAIHVGFSMDIQPLAGSDFNNSIQVMINGVDYTSSGTTTQSGTAELTWTPASPTSLPIGAYTITVNNLRRVGAEGDTPMQSPYTFAFVVPPK